MKLWIVALFVVSFSFACGIKYKPEPQGAPAGVERTDSRNIVGFTKIKAQNAIDLNVSSTGGYSIVLKGDESVLPSVITELQGDTLVISLKDTVRSTSKVSVSVTLPKLAALELSGAVHASVKDVKADSFELSVTGASSAEISGEARSVHIKAVGSSTVNAEDLKAQIANVESVGASKVTVSASDGLSADASGASSVTYVGEPKSLKQNATDVSSITKK